MRRSSWLLKSVEERGTRTRTRQGAQGHAIRWRGPGCRSACGRSPVGQAAGRGHSARDRHSSARDRHSMAHAGMRWRTTHRGVVVTSISGGSWPLRGTARQNPGATAPLTCHPGDKARPTSACGPAPCLPRLSVRLRGAVHFRPSAVPPQPYAPAVARPCRHVPGSTPRCAAAPPRCCGGAAPPGSWRSRSGCRAAGQQEARGQAGGMGGNMSMRQALVCVFGPDNTSPAAGHRAAQSETAVQPYSCTRVMTRVTKGVPH